MTNPPPLRELLALLKSFSVCVLVNVHLVHPAKQRTATDALKVSEWIRVHVSSEKISHYGVSSRSGKYFGKSYTIGLVSSFCKRGKKRCWERSKGCKERPASGACIRGRRSRRGALVIFTVEYESTIPSGLLLPAIRRADYFM